MDRYVQANGIELHCLDHPGALPPLILLPGLTANAHTFDGLIQAGLARDRRVIAVDLRGRAQSAKPLTGYRMADHAADIVGLLDAWALDRVYLGGHSFGGLLGCYLAAHYPDRIVKLVIIDAAAALHPRARELIQPSVERIGTLYASWDAYLTAMKRMPFYAGWWDPALESSYAADLVHHADGTVQSLSSRAAILQALDGLVAEPWLEHVARIAQPALLLNATGAYGPAGTPPVVPREFAEATVRALAQGRYREVPGNHMTMLYDVGAPQVVAAINDFLG